MSHGGNQSLLWGWTDSWEHRNMAKERKTLQPQKRGTESGQENHPPTCSEATRQRTLVDLPWKRPNYMCGGEEDGGISLTVWFHLSEWNGMKWNEMEWNEISMKFHKSISPSVPCFPPLPSLSLHPSHSLLPSFLSLSFLRVLTITLALFFLPLLLSLFFS